MHMILFGFGTKTLRPVFQQDELSITRQRCSRFERTLTLLGVRITILIGRRYVADCATIVGVHHVSLILDSSRSTTNITWPGLVQAEMSLPLSGPCVRAVSRPLRDSTGAEESIRIYTLFVSPGRPRRPCWDGHSRRRAFIKGRCSSSRSRSRK